MDAWSWEELEETKRATTVHAATTAALRAENARLRQRARTLLGGLRLWRSAYEESGQTWVVWFTERELLAAELGRALCREAGLRSMIEGLERVWMYWLEGGTGDDAMDALIAIGEAFEGGEWDTLAATAPAGDAGEEA